MRKPVLALILGLSLLCITTNVHAVSLDFVPASQNVIQGNPLSVALVISGLGDMMAPSLSVFDVDITFDPAILAFSSAVFGDSVLGDQLDPAGLGSLISADSVTPGVINIFEISFDAPNDLDTLQADSFTLARLTFNAIDQGQSFLSLAVNSLGDANGDTFIDMPDIGSPAEVTVTPRDTSSVPEPGTIVLFVTGCLGLLGYGWVRGSHETQ